jgi:PKD repeat protein
MLIVLLRILESTYFKITVFILCISLSVNLQAQNQHCADVDFTIDLQERTVNVSGQSQDSITQWYWHFGNGITKSGQYATFSYEKNGVFEICLKVQAHSPATTSNALCTGIICKKVTIGSNSEDDDCGLSADFEFTVSENNIKVRGKSNDADARYLWTVSGQNVQQTGQEAVFKVEKSGFYEVCMTVVDSAESCKVQICKKVEVKGICNLIADFSYEYVDGVYRFFAKSNTIASSVTGLLYYWDFGDGNTSEGPVTKHIYAQDGIFEVCLFVRDTRTGCYAKICKSINSDEGCNLQVDFKFSVTGNGVVFAGRSSNPNVKYYWDFGNGTSGEGQTARNVYQTRGVFVVCLTVVDEENGCKSQVCKRVLVGRPVLGPTISDVDGTLIKNVVIFPNPASSIINIQSRTLKISEIAIFNFQQIEVVRKSSDALLVTIDITSLPEGIYTVHVTLDDGSIHILRFYKQ